MKTRKKKSRIFQIVAGVSLNGKIADEHGEFMKYSSKEDKAFVRKKILESDVVVVGRKTFEKHIQPRSEFEKPLIIFTKMIKGFRLIPNLTDEVHFFHDKKEELINLCDLLQYRTVTILGGAEVYHWFLKQKLATDVFLTIEPIIFGKGKNLLIGDLLADQKSWKLRSTDQLNKKGTLLLHYQRL